MLLNNFATKVWIIQIPVNPPKGVILKLILAKYDLIFYTFLKIDTNIMEIFNKSIILKNTEPF